MCFVLHNLHFTSLADISVWLNRKTVTLQSYCWSDQKHLMWEVEIVKCYSGVKCFCEAQTERWQQQSDILLHQKVFNCQHPSISCSVILRGKLSHQLLPVALTWRGRWNTGTPLCLHTAGEQWRRHPEMEKDNTNAHNVVPKASGHILSDRKSQAL